MTLGSSVTWDIFYDVTCDWGVDLLEWKGILPNELLTNAHRRRYINGSDSQSSRSTARASSLEELIAAFHVMRGRIGSLFALAGIDTSKTRGPARELGISRGLAWRLTRMIREADPTSAISSLPGGASMARFFESCRAGACRTRRSKRPPTRSSGLKRTALVHGRPQDAGNDDGQPPGGHRGWRSGQGPAQLFEGACGVWGVQAQTRFVTVFVFPSPDDPTKLDAGHVTGFVGFRRLSGKPWPAQLRSGAQVHGGGSSVREGAAGPQRHGRGPVAAHQAILLAGGAGHQGRDVGRLQAV